MSRTDHNLFGVQQEKAELDSALREFREQWGPFCRSLGITVYQLRSLDPAVLVALIFLHLNTQLGEKLNEHEERLRALERVNEVGPTRAAREARREATFDLTPNSSADHTPSTGDN